MLFIMPDDQFKKQYADTHTVWGTVRDMPILKPTAIGRRVEPATLFSLQLAIYFLGATFGAQVTFYELYSTGAFEQSSIFMIFFFVLVLRVWQCERECECICCSFHLNYPAADLLVTTWRCTILKHFVSHTVGSTIEYALRALSEWSTILS